MILFYLALRFYSRIYQDLVLMIYKLMNSYFDTKFFFVNFLIQVIANFIILFLNFDIFVTSFIIKLLFFF